jgi:hypothetical protein
LFNTATVGLKFVRVPTNTGFTWVRVDQVELIHSEAADVGAPPVIVMLSGRVVSLRNDHAIDEFLGRISE